METSFVLGIVKKHLTNVPDHDLDLILRLIRKFNKFNRKELVEQLTKLIKDYLPHNYINDLVDAFDKQYLNRLNGKSNFEYLKKQTNRIKSEQNETCYEFKNIFENSFFIYKTRIENPKFIKEPIVDYYLLMGEYLFEKKCWISAIKYANKALEYYPYSAKAFLQIAKYKLYSGDQDDFLDNTLQALELAYTKEDLSSCYLNIGFYYAEQGELYFALCSYIVASCLNNNELVHKEISYVKKAIGSLIIMPNEQNIVKEFRKRGIQLGPNEEVIYVAMRMRRLCESSKNIVKIDEILFDLTTNKDILKKIEGVQLN